MALAEDLQAKRPGEWTSEDISSLKSKYKRTHFTHFGGSKRKLKSRKDNGYVWVEVGPGRYKRIKKGV